MPNSVSRQARLPTVGSLPQQHAAGAAKHVQVAHWTTTAGKTQTAVDNDILCHRR